MKICKICGHKHHAKGYCQRHYWQMKTYGEIKGNTQQTQCDPNEFIIDGDICRIKLYDEFGNEKAEAIIDAEDYERVKDRKWRLTHGYVRESKTSLLLHQFIIGKPKKGLEPDHRDGNTLDNRKKNLRVCTHAENMYNQIKPISNTSGYKGVSWHKRDKKWMAYIRKDGKLIHSGYFTSLIDAALAYNKAALEHFGEFARLNIIKGDCDAV